MEIYKIKEEILSTLNEMRIAVNSIILFGSRARGDYTKYSDYDFLIITEKTFHFKEKMEIAKKLRVALAEFHIPTDIIINSTEEIESKKNKIGYTTRYALQEGIVI